MEILFRGKRIDTGEWVYGTPIYDGKIVYILSGVIEANEEYICIEVWNPVIPETVGQYTGYKDENGKRIFGGDFIQSGTCIAKVVFEKGAFVLKSNGGYTHKALILNQSVWQVIGDAMDNPELLDG